MYVGLGASKKRHIVKGIDMNNSLCGIHLEHGSFRAAPRVVDLEPCHACEERYDAT